MKLLATKKKSSSAFKYQSASWNKPSYIIKGSSLVSGSFNILKSEVVPS